MKVVIMLKTFLEEERGVTDCREQMERSKMFRLEKKDSFYHLYILNSLLTFSLKNSIPEQEMRDSITQIFSSSAIYLPNGVFKSLTIIQITNVNNQQTEINLTECPNLEECFFNCVQGTGDCCKISLTGLSSIRSLAIDNCIDVKFEISHCRI